VTEEALEMLAETVPTSVARIRRFVADAALAVAPDVETDTVALLVSEVATNALVHGEGQVRVRVLATVAGVRVEVHDESTALPAKREATVLDEGGRGVALVEALSSSWGSAADDGGKTVWFEVEAR
jgi:anti-sigma regulatory factor (Ser/Thr protein kinase)